MNDNYNGVEYDAFYQYQALRRWIWGAIAEQSIKTKDFLPADFLKDALRDFNNMVYMHSNAEMASGWAEMLGTEIKIETYEDLGKVHDDSFSNKVNSGKYDLPTASFIIATRALRNEIETMSNALNEGRPTQIVKTPQSSQESQIEKGQPNSTHLFLINGITNPFVEFNKYDLDDITDKNFEILIKSYNIKRLNNETVSMPIFIETEFNEFQKLFSSTNDDWGYLSKRLGTDKAHLQRLKELSYDIVQGDYEKTYYDFDTERRRDYGWLLAARKYIDFLRSPHSQVAGPIRIKKQPDDRIALNEKEKDFIESCFSSFLQDEHYMFNGASVMRDEDFYYFLRANFTGFGTPLPRKLFEVSFNSKKTFCSFIKQILVRLYKDERYDHEFHKYRSLPKNNFAAFTDGKLVDKSIIDYFSSQLDPKHPLYKVILDAEQKYLRKSTT